MEIIDRNITLKYAVVRNYVKANTIYISLPILCSNVYFVDVWSKRLHCCDSDQTS